MKLYYLALLLFISAFSVIPNSNALLVNDMAFQEGVTIPLNRWNSQRALSHLVGKLISESGTKVSYLNITSDEQWGALQRGLIHFQLEVWQPSMETEFNLLVAKGDILEMGAHDARVREEWWYPNYVQSYCPELPDWQALNKCSNLFKSSTSKDKGVYFSGPWYYSDASIIRSLDLAFTIERRNDSKSLWDELKNAAKENRPIMLLNWSPNWTDVHSLGKFIEFPDYEKECTMNPQWGINNALTDDCGNIKNGWLKKAATPNLQKSFPCVYSLIKQVNFSHEMIAYAAYLMVVEQKSESVAADVLRKKYANRIKQWLPENCGFNPESFALQ